MMHDDVEVVRIGPDAWGRVRATRLAALQDTPDAFGMTLDRELAKDEDDWRAWIGHPDRVFLLAELTTEERAEPPSTAAGITVVAPAYEDPDAAGIYAVWVAPWARGYGVGDALMQAALQAAREIGHRRAVLDVGDDNHAAQRLYLRNGFVPTGATGSLPPPRTHVTEHELAVDL
jgi:ribosomal protein S18 acetylase RimI-like enzyme